MIDDTYKSVPKAFKKGGKGGGLTLMGKYEKTWWECGRVLRTRATITCAKSIRIAWDNYVDTCLVEKGYKETLND